VQLLKKVLLEASGALQGQVSEDLDPARVEVASVDGFQGREKDIIVFSGVRANDRGQVGFLADWRRVNVMLTRAKYGVVIICNSATLRCETETWAHWLRWAQTNHCVIGSGTSRFGEYDESTVKTVRGMGERRMQATLRAGSGEADSRSIERRIENAGMFGEEKFDAAARAKNEASVAATMGPRGAQGGDSDSWGADTSAASNVKLTVPGGDECDDWETDGAWDD
jgi:hypothetical protein